MMVMMSHVKYLQDLVVNATRTFAGGDGGDGGGVLLDDG